MALDKGLITGELEVQYRRHYQHIYRQNVNTNIAVNGVVGSGFRVAAQSPASGSVNVTAGHAVSQRTAALGVVPLTWHALQTLDIFGPNPMQNTNNPRIDIVILDADLGVLRSVTGTPAANPSDPATPDGAIRLARLRHAANADTIPVSAVTDMRTYTSVACNYPGAPAPPVFPTLQNGWENYANGYELAHYRKGLDGMVVIGGMVKRATSGANGTTIFNLPTSFRPSAQRLFSVAAYSSATQVGSCRIDIASNGDIKFTHPGAGSNSTFVSLDGISFVVV